MHCVPRVWSFREDRVCFHLPLAKSELGLLHSVPFNDTQHLRCFIADSAVILGDGSHLFPSRWGGDGVELVALFIGYVRVLVV